MYKLLHTRIRVSDLEQSIRFYEDNLGFKVFSRSERSPHGNQIVHLELPGNDHTIELTYSADYDLNVPEDLMHFAIGVPDLIASIPRRPDPEVRGRARGRPADGHAGGRLAPETDDWL